MERPVAASALDETNLNYLGEILNKHPHQPHRSQLDPTRLFCPLLVI